jgi:aryl-alcohol dehydrogenase-like predicted oxidoreductase
MAALGRPGYMTLGHADDLQRNYDEAAMERHAHEVLDTAWNSGVRYFDTARSYGLAEKFLSSWLHQRKILSNEIIIASKWGYTYTADWKVSAAVHEVKDHSVSVLRKQWRESSDLLGEHLRIYQIHSTTLETGVLNDAGVLNELALLKNQGVWIGLTVTGSDQASTVRRAMEVMIDGVGLFDVVQATWNLLETSVGPALSEARSAGMSVVIKEGMANGRLTERNDSVSFAPKLNLLRSEASALGCSIDSLVLASILVQPFVDIVLSGAATSEQLKTNLRGENIARDLDPVTLSRLTGIAEPPMEYWSTRKHLKWN